jgi:hypothetical protein
VCSHCLPVLTVRVVAVALAPDVDVMRGVYVCVVVCMRTRAFAQPHEHNHSTVSSEDDSTKQTT